MRAYRTGKIHSENFTIPIKLYPVIKKPPKLAKLIDEKTHAPIGLRDFSKKILTYRPVPTYTNKSVFPILQFANLNQVDWRLLNKSYYAIPCKKTDGWYEALTYVLFYTKKAAVIGFPTRASNISEAILMSNSDYLLLFQLHNFHQLSPIPQYSTPISDPEKNQFLLKQVNQQTKHFPPLD